MTVFTTTNLLEAEMEKAIVERIEALKDDISLGSLSSFEEYRHVTGQIAGLREALECVDTARKRVAEKTR